MFHALPVDLVSHQLLAEVKFVPDSEDITETVVRLVLLTGGLREVHHQGPLVTLTGVTEVVVERDVLYTVHSLTLEIILHVIITVLPRVLTVAKITNTGETCQD